MRTTPEIVEDACSFAWVQFMRHQPDRERAWRSWLVVTAEREAWRLDRIARADDPLRSDDAAGDLRFNEPAATGIEEETRSELHEALGLVAELPDRRRRAMELKLTGLTYEEIAAEMGVSKTRATHLIREANEAIAMRRERRADVFAPRSPRAARLAELEKSPPPWLVGAIGRPAPACGSFTSTISVTRSGLGWPLRARSRCARSRSGSVTATSRQP